MGDLVTRLRELANHRAKILGKSPEEMEEWQAAKEIVGLRVALKPFAQAADDHMEQYEIALSVGGYVPIDDNAEICVPITLGECSRARAKLEGSGA